MTSHKLVFHIGQTKTGTTSIQNFLHRNQKQLELSGIYYSKRPYNSISHRYLFHLASLSAWKNPTSTQAIRHRNRLKEIFQTKESPKAEDLWTYFNENLLKKSCNISILSEELFWESSLISDSSSMHITSKLSDVLHRVFPPQNITLLVALRHHGEWLESWHNQMVKDQANQFKVARFFKSTLSRDALAYRKKIDAWKEVFPQAKIKVIDFNTQLVSPQPIGLRFLEEAGLTDHLSKQSLLRMVYPERVQESIHPILPAFLIREKPLIHSRHIYKTRIQEADKVIRAKLFELGTKDSFTVLSPSVINECHLLHDSDHLSLFGIDQLEHYFDLKKRVPRVLEPEITTYLDNKFNG